MTASKKTKSIEANLTGFTFLFILIIGFYSCKISIFDKSNIFTVSPDSWWQYVNWFFMAYTIFSGAISMKKFFKAQKIKSKVFHICFISFKILAAYTLLSGNYNLLFCNIVFFAITWILFFVTSSIIIEAKIFNNVYSKNRNNVT